jgi:hypothetical protein
MKISEEYNILLGQRGNYDNEIKLYRAKIVEYEGIIKQLNGRCEQLTEDGVKRSK